MRKYKFRFKFWYELLDMYETENFDCGKLLLTTDSKEELRRFADQYIKDTDGECRLFVKVWKQQQKEDTQ